MSPLKPEHPPAETTRLLDLFKNEQEIPIHPVEEEEEQLSRPSRYYTNTTCPSSQCISSTIIGSVTFLLYHVVFCLAQASTITRPHATTPILGPVAKMSAVGILFSAPVFIWFLGDSVPCIYPTTDLFLAPFLADLAHTIDQELYKHGLQDDNVVFLETFAAVAGAGLLLSGTLCVLASRVKLANLGAFLPYSVLCGFFTAIGLLMWTLAFGVDTGGKKIAPVLLSGDWTLIGHCLLHHLPSLVVGTACYFLGSQHPYLVVTLVVGTIFGSYVLMFLTGTTHVEAQEMGWFWMSSDLVNPENPGLGFASLDPPAPFGVLHSINKVHWKAFQKGLPMVCALAFLYLIRCSLHTAALKKNIPLLTRTPPEPPSPLQRRSRYRRKETKQPPVTLQKILEEGYGYSQIAAALVGGIAVAPAVGSSLTLFKLGADGVAPQYGSVLLVAIFYLTDFQLVRYIPKPAFSSLLILAFEDLVMTWLINSYRKTKAKWEWMVTPLIVILTFLVGLLNAIFLGVACSTFIFVASFYRSGVVKFLANGLTVRSTIERAHREASWLDQNGDYIQVVVLQNYLFFGNAQSILTYIQTMFEGDDRVFDVENHVTLPPHPHHLILDFSIVSGMDTSAQDVLGEIVSLCQKNKCRLYLAGLAPNLRSNLLYAGLKPEPRKFSFQPDLESSLGKAEDSLLRDVFLIFEKEKHDAGVRRRVRSVSDVEDGFQYALRRIDEQHGTNFLPKLVGLERYTKIVELEPGQTLFQDEGGNVGESARGFFFIEHGLMRVEKRMSDTLSGSSLRVTAPVQRHVTEAQASIGHLNAREETARVKQVRMADHVVQSIRLARIGAGWVVGTIEGCSGMRNPGIHVAVTACRLHLLPYASVKEIEKTDPALILGLFRLVSLLTARQQELTIEHLAQFVAIMSSTPINRISTAGVERDNGHRL